MTALAPKRGRVRRPKGLGHIREVRPGVYQVKIDLKAPGKGQRRTVYETVKGDRAAAEAKLALLRAQAAQGVRFEDSKQRLDGWIENWLTQEIEGTLGDKSAERYRELLTKHVLPTLGAYRLKELNASHIRGLYKHLGAKLAPATVRYVHSVLASCLNDAEADRLIDSNPARLVSRRRRKKLKDQAAKTKQPKMKIVSAEAIEAVLAECKRGNYQNVPYAMALLAFDSGARRGEYLAANWGALDPSTGTLTLARALDETKAKGVRIKDEMKTEASVRNVKLHANTVQALSELRDSRPGWKPDHLIFPHTPQGVVQDPLKPIPPRFVTKQFPRIAAKAGVTGLRLHDARHNCASHMVKAGRPFPEIQERLGHATLSTTLDWYVHNVPEKAWEGIGR